jgi:hypothetical protein
MLTTAAVPSWEFENSNARQLEGKLGDGYENDGCSDG